MQRPVSSHRLPTFTGPLVAHHALVGQLLITLVVHEALSTSSPLAAVLL